MDEIVVREVVETGDIAAVRRLMQAYGEHLAAHPAGAANICLEGVPAGTGRVTGGLYGSVAGAGGWGGGWLCGFAASASFADGGAGV